MENTRDLMDFGIEELRKTAKLLSVLKTLNDHTLRLGEVVTPEFNPDSGYVFLIDSNFNVAMLNGEVLEDWAMCHTCSREGFHSDLAKAETCCSAFIKQLLTSIKHV